MRAYGIYSSQILTSRRTIMTDSDFGYQFTNLKWLTSYTNANSKTECAQCNKSLGICSFQQCIFGIILMKDSESAD